MAKTASSKHWIQKHNSDYYVIQAKKLNYRSRASFKIIEIQKKYKIFNKNMFVVDLGAAPGGWSQQITKYIDNKSKIIALDLLAMVPIEGVDFIQGDFSNNETSAKLNELTSHREIDCIVSDMAPNISGNKTTDQAKSMLLLELALDFANNRLKKSGTFVAKIFQGQGSDEYLNLVRKSFHKIIQFKPKSSRPQSKEFYIIALKFKG